MITKEMEYQITENKENLFRGEIAQVSVVTLNFKYGNEPADLSFFENTVGFK